MKWLQLVRASNAPTAAANILAAFLMAHQDWAQRPELLLLIVSSVALYCSGMVLNDVFDIDADRVSQPNRPLPSGSIGLSSARNLGWALMGFGFVCAIAAGAFSAAPLATLRCGGVAALLAVAIYLYDGPLKRTALAPITMGSCRSLNFLLGAATYSMAATNDSASAAPLGDEILGFPIEVVLASVAIGVLVTGITLLARNESKPEQSRRKITIAGFVIAFGFLMFAAIAIFPSARLPTEALGSYPLLIALVAAVPLRHIVMCVAQPQPKNLKSAIISSLRTLIVLDASLCFLTRPDNPAFALLVLALLIPVFVLSNWLYST